MKHSLVKILGAGLLLVILIITIHQQLATHQGKQFLAIIFVIIGAIYYGFAFLSANKRARLVEILSASFFVLLGIFGLWYSSWLVFLGLLVHGFWDIIHHKNHYWLVKVPGWYLPFCVVIDWALALYILFILLAENGFW